ncbi:uncharacterized protein L3040_001393 [Drepanopeziza brunnea f. sp. 'multigermtubi']|uniref:uncharacterized protein n=1 Tax=Drepanopeziza brunnea f. sp. 'multigermtubi' TaxID=698441 RepID=UPI0023846748|nr:hypothetical protein L3040_001393 [Drepanopeziza brunnea f. sp. 'multigermtubi']
MSPPSSDVERYTLQLKSRLGQILRSKRHLRIVGLALLALLVVTYTLCNPRSSFIIVYPAALIPSNSADPAAVLSHDGRVDWSRFAYTQYVTNREYLCNSVMLFEILHRLGSRADRLIMYPDWMSPDPASSSVESQLLLKAQKEYKVKLVPIQVQHRPQDQDKTWEDSYTKLLAFNQTQYSRVLSLDSDSTVLQTMDELFLLPPAPVAVPRAYWLDKPYLSSQIALIEPSAAEFKRVKDAIDAAAPGDFDMEIINNLYGKDCIVIPHRRYGLITREFRSERPHSEYLGNDHEEWDPEKAFKEAKFLHFSDWPAPKPWLPMSESARNANQPKCVELSGGAGDCRGRDLWLGFYSDFRKRRKDICEFNVD